MTGDLDWRLAGGADDRYPRFREDVRDRPDRGAVFFPLLVGQFSPRDQARVEPFVDVAVRTVRPACFLALADPPLVFCPGQFLDLVGRERERAARRAWLDPRTDARQLRGDVAGLSAVRLAQILGEFRPRRRG